MNFRFVVADFREFFKWKGKRSGLYYDQNYFLDHRKARPAGDDVADGGQIQIAPQDVLDMPVDPNEPTYCLCRQVSYGEMIGCDNPDVSFFDYFWVESWIYNVF